MEPVLTPEEMRRADDATIAQGTPSFELMERAAAACASVALRTLGSGYGRRVVVVCGPGNNGGDGIAAAGCHAQGNTHTQTRLHPSAHATSRADSHAYAHTHAQTSAHPAAGIDAHAGFRHISDVLPP